MFKWILILLLLIFSVQTRGQSNYIYGITLDNIDSLNDIVSSLSNLSKKPTARIVFDEWMPATYYLEPCTEIHNVSFIMGELLDSYPYKNYSIIQFTDRCNDYLKTLGNIVDIWEIGNETNGEWLGNKDSVIKKLTIAHDIFKNNNKPTSLTLYYNHDCWEDSNNEMFTWVNNYLPANIKQGLDYVFVSYYEDDCNNYQPNWNEVFDSLHTLFPNSKLGIGECGTKLKKKKAEYMQRYYSMNIETPNYVGGYFWWYYKQDCVPYTKPLWRALDNILKTYK